MYCMSIVKVAETLTALKKNGAIHVCSTGVADPYHILPV